MEGVRVEKFVPFTSNLHSVAFVNVKFHLPGEFPVGYRIHQSHFAARPRPQLIRGVNKPRPDKQTSSCWPSPHNSPVKCSSVWVYFH